MPEWVQVISATAAVFAVVALGFGLRRRGWLTAEADESLLRLVVRVLMPALILRVVIGNDAVDERINLWLPPVWGYASVVLGVGVAGLVAWRVGPRLGLRTARQRRTFAVSVGMYNYGYVAIPLAEMLYDRETVGVLFIHNVGVDLAMWTLCVAVIAGGGGGRAGSGAGWKRVATGVLNPPAVAIVAALLLNAADAEAWMPAGVEHVIDMLGRCAIPVALLMVGATMADHFRRRDLIGGKRVVAAAAVLRLGLLPLAFVGVAAVLPGSAELARVICLQAAMPAAVFPIVLARHYGGDVHVAVRVALVTSALSLVTTPAWLALAGR